MLFQFLNISLLNILERAWNMVHLLGFYSFLMPPETLYGSPPDPQVGFLWF